MRDQLHARYLIPEAFDQIIHFFRTSPILAGVLAVVIYGLILAILRKAFGRIGYEVLLIALLICAIALFLSSAGYTLFNVQGFRFVW